MTEAPPSTAPPSTLDRTSTEASAATARRGPRLNPRAAITGLLSIAIIGLAIWSLARPEPLLVQGEAQSTRIDIAARVSGRLAKIPVVRGQDVAAGATLLVIDNPELIAELHEAEAEKMVADAELARINVGTRSEIIAIEARSGHRRADLAAKAARPSQPGLSGGGEGLHRRGAPDRRGEYRQGGGKDRDHQGTGGSDGGHGAGRIAGLSDPRRRGRGRDTGCAAAILGGSRRHLARVFVARGPDRGPQGRRPVQGPHPGARRPRARRRSSRAPDQARIRRLARDSA